MADVKPYEKWTDKEKLFAHEYLVDQNMTAAAIRAGYSEKSARDQGHKLYHKPHINQWITERLEQKCEKLEITSDRILQEVALIGFQNIAGAFKADNTLKSIADMPESLQRVIAGVDIDELFEGRGEDREHVGFTKKLRTWDKLKALELLGKNMKLWTDKVEINDRPMVHVKNMTGRKTPAKQDSE